MGRPGSRKYVKKRPKGKEVATKRYVKQAITRRLERHYAYEATSATGGVECTTTGAFTKLSDAMAKGDAATSREGDEVKMDFWKMNCELIRNASAAAGSQDRVRIVVFQWALDDAVTAPNTAATLYDTTNEPILAPLDVVTSQGRAQLHVLYDKSFTINDKSREGNSRKFTISIPGKKLKKFRFRSGSDTQGHNMLYIMRLGSNVTGNETTQLHYYGYGYFRE